MKITKRQLRRIIKEEKARLMEVNYSSGVGELVSIEIELQAVHDMVAKRGNPYEGQAASYIARAIQAINNAMDELNSAGERERSVQPTFRRK
jgi:hypothetical protein